MVNFNLKVSRLTTSTIQRFILAVINCSMILVHSANADELTDAVSTMSRNIAADIRKSLPIKMTPHSTIVAAYVYDGAVTLTINLSYNRQTWKHTIATRGQTHDEAIREMTESVTMSMCAGEMKLHIGVGVSFVQRYYFENGEPHSEITVDSC